MSRTLDEGPVDASVLRYLNAGSNGAKSCLKGR